VKKEKVIGVALFVSSSSFGAQWAAVFPVELLTLAEPRSHGSSWRLPTRQRVLRPRPQATPRGLTVSQLCQLDVM